MTWAVILAIAAILCVWGFISNLRASYVDEGITALTVVGFLLFSGLSILLFRAARKAGRDYLCNIALMEEFRPDNCILCEGGLYEDGEDLVCKECNMKIFTKPS